MLSEYRYTATERWLNVDMSRGFWLWVQVYEAGTLCKIVYDLSRVVSYLGPTCR